MATIKRFEELTCWQAARELTKMVYALTENERFSKSFELRNQIRKAALSTMNNIAEGFGRFSNKEFIRFLEMASSSGSEVKSMAYVLEDLGMLKESELSELFEKTDSVIKQCLSFIKYLKGKVNSK